MYVDTTSSIFVFLKQAVFLIRYRFISACFLSERIFYRHISLYIKCVILKFQVKKKENRLKRECLKP